MDQPRMGPAWRRHERKWMDNRYVYPVVSRRSRGVSIGINLNPDKGCNFHCIYCQVDRTVPPEVREVDLGVLSSELDAALSAERDGSLYARPPLDILLPGERGVRDIAFSGDGEPTVFPRFEEAVRIASGARLRFGLDSAKLVLLTNAAYLDRPAVRSALAVLGESNGEIWAKLDAGTEAYYRKVNRPDVPFGRILGNITLEARERPLTIQSLWFAIAGELPPDEELHSYCERLNGVLAAGGRIRLVQLHTIARDPAERFSAPLSRPELDRIGALVRDRVPVPVEVFYGAGGS